MHILTKLLVVLTSVLAVLLAGLTIAYSANADRLVEAAKSSEAAMVAERERANSSESRTAANVEKLNRQLSRLEGEKVAAETRLTNLRQEIEDLSAENQRLNLAEQSLRDQIQSFVLLAQQSDSFRAADREEIAELRGELNRLSTRIIDLVDRNSDIESQLDASNNQVRALEEQLVALRRGNSGTAGSSAALPSTFRARVTEVKTDSDGAVLIGINAGTSDRLAEGAELVVVRGGLFLGKIRLINVDLNEAVGRLVLDADNGEIRDRDEIRPAA